MTERDVDWQLVTRVQRGDKHAYELLVSKYQRRITRLLSRIIRDPSDIEDVAQEAFIKAYRALPSFRGESAFYTWLYRIAINTAKNHFAAQGRRAPVRSSGELDDAENLEEAVGLRDVATPDAVLLSKQVGEAVNRDRAARTRGYELRRNCDRDELPSGHGAIANLPCARSGGCRIAAAARHTGGPTLVKEIFV
jgi:RNA polymerase sigma-70 factor (ECF subfamily)